VLLPTGSIAQNAATLDDDGCHELLIFQKQTDHSSIYLTKVWWYNQAMMGVVQQTICHPVPPPVTHVRERVCVCVCVCDREK
jgi:hypothetical protein